MKALDQPKIELDGVSYVLELWPTSAAFEWQQRLLDLGLEPVAMAMSDGERSWSDLTEADFPTIARTLLGKVKREHLPDIMKSLLVGVIRQDRDEKHGGALRPVRITDGDYEVFYRGRTLHLYKLAGWVIAENLQDFSTAARSIGEALRERFSTASSDEEGAAASEDPAESSETPKT